MSQVNINRIVDEKYFKLLDRIEILSRVKGADYWNFDILRWGGKTSQYATFTIYGTEKPTADVLNVIRRYFIGRPTDDSDFNFGRTVHGRKVIGLISYEPTNNVIDLINSINAGINTTVAFIKGYSAEFEMPKNMRARKTTVPSSSAHSSALSPSIKSLENAYKRML